MNKLRLLPKVPSDKNLDPIDRRLRDEFGVSREGFRTCVREAHEAKITTSPLAPKTSAGLRFYEQLIVALRTRFLSDSPGWTLASVRNQEFIQHEERGVRIGYVKTDAGTAQFHPETGTLLPMTSVRPRGKAGRHTVASNQLMLFQSSDIGGATPVGFRTWLVAVHATFGGYRVEIALPVRCDEGHIVGWEDRIAIGEVTLDSDPKLPKDTGAQAAKPRAQRKKH